VQPLFDIKDLFFPITHIVFNGGYTPKLRIEPELEVQAELRKIPRRKNTWELNLHIKTPSEMDNSTFPYEFFLSVTALLIHARQDGLTRPQIKYMKKLLYVNGASVLYSAARDRLLLLTGSASIQPYCLPSYRFNPEDCEK
jgi:preprotein translocase subunit SecB